MWLGHYESEVKQLDLKEPTGYNELYKDLQSICGWDIMNYKLNNLI